MALALTAAPAAEPLSLAEAKAQLRIDSDEEDALVASLITTARLWTERSYGLALITQDWSLYLDRWPEGKAVALPLAPLQSVTGVTLHGEDDAATALDASSYAVDLSSRPGRLVLTGSSGGVSLRRLNAIEIAYRAGYGDDGRDVPAPIRQGLLLLVAHWYESREPVVAGYEPPEVPAMVAGLLAPYRGLRL